MPKLTAMMTVKNEGNRYLKRCLEALEKYVDEIVVLDDASTDETPEICLKFPLVKLYRNESSMFLVDESKLREKLWHYTIENKPEWILAIDADELMEESGIKEFPYLIKQKDFNAISFRLFDCWESEEYYRTDGIWNPWLRGFSIYGVKYQPQLADHWPSLKFHCGRFPLAYRKLLSYETTLRIKHLGWIDSNLNKAKYERCLRQDPNFEYMSKEHYESIIYPPEKIKLEKWVELL
ncbi:glycosyltransferase [Alkaliphilus transvaalensis]|uniref:glycosyltransferase n=1 Tax=Alkaliphilus transvaalensis TaxID=114628 RepID=UPI00047AAF1A|nr:glycosyltransferase [Alkaliphilus transvaalensis]